MLSNPKKRDRLRSAWALCAVAILVIAVPGFADSQAPAQATRSGATLASSADLLLVLGLVGLAIFPDRISGKRKEVATRD